MEYKHDANMEKKLCNLRKTHSLDTENVSDHVLLAMSRMNLEKVKLIANSYHG